MPRLKIFLKWAIPIIFFVILSFDGKSHWDETNFLYKAAYVPIRVDSPWLVDNPFYQVRMGHICWLKLLFTIFGVGIRGLLIVETVMALMILGGGFLFYLAIGNLFRHRDDYFTVFFAFIFSPVSLYLGFKSLGETTALFFTALSIYLYVKSLRVEKKDSLLLNTFTALSLFVAANAREASLLAFFSIAFTAIYFYSGRRKAAFLKLIFIYSIWLIPFLVVGLSTHIWCVSHLLTLSKKYALPMASDISDYPPNIIGLVLFGGSFWIFILIALTQWRKKITRFAIISSVIIIIPLTVHATHIEMRFLSSAIFGFSLLAGIGIVTLFQALKNKFGRRNGFIITIVTVILAIIFNQIMVVPLQEVGVNGIQLCKLMNRINHEYDDPLLLMAHPHSMYSFLRICYPENRIFLDQYFEGLISQVAVKSGDIEEEKAPWLYLTPFGPRERPLLTRILHHIKGVNPPERGGISVPRDSWITRSDSFEMEEVDREENYLLYRLRIPAGS